MIRLIFVCLLVFVIGGCGAKFTDLGNGVGVPTDSIEAYAESNNISRDEAKQRMREEMQW